MNESVCPKCGSSDIIGKLPIADHGHGQSVYELAIAIRTPGNDSVAEWLFGYDPFSAKVKAWICVTCGYTEFYTTNAKKLKAALINKRNKELKKKTK